MKGTIFPLGNVGIFGSSSDVYAIWEEQESSIKAFDKLQLSPHKFKRVLHGFLAQMSNCWYISEHAFDNSPYSTLKRPAEHFLFDSR